MDEGLPEVVLLELVTGTLSDATTEFDAGETILTVSLGVEFVTAGIWIVGTAGLPADTKAEVDLAIHCINEQQDIEVIYHHHISLQ